MISRQVAFRWSLLVITGFACLLIFFPFLMEILLAAFFAFALSPVTRKLQAHKTFGRKGWVVVTVIGLILAIVVPIVLLVVASVNLFSDLTSEGFQNSELVQDIVHAKTFIMSTGHHLLDRFHIRGHFNVSAMTNNLISGTGAKIMATSTTIAARVPDFVLSLFIFCCALFLFLAEGRKVRNMLAHNKFIPHEDLDRLIQIFQRSCYTTLFASVAVGAIQATTVAVGSLILQSHHALLIFLMTFIFSFIPVIGAAPVAFFMGALSLFKGDNGIAIGYLVIGIVAGTMDNIIRPWLAKGEGDVHAVVMLIAIIGAIMIFGLPGLFLGPMFVSVATQVYRLFVFEDSTPTAQNIKS